MSKLKAGFSSDAVAASSGRTGEPGVCKLRRPGKFWSTGKQGFSRDKSIVGSSLFFIVWPFLFRLEFEGQYYGRC
jgi:hypothetical protein